MKRLTTQDFIKRAKSIHGNRYGYSKSIYINKRTKIKILCKAHGEFLQLPLTHTMGHGCPECGSNQLDTKSFISRATKIHNNSYDYSKVNYTGIRSPITIMCRKHGKFTQTPTTHLSGSGCAQCGNDKIAIAQSYSSADRIQLTENFIKKATKIHNNSYDYSQSKITRLRDSVKILCKKHGTFYQVARNHLKGHMCPKCSNKLRGNHYSNKQRTKKQLQFIEQAKSIHGNIYSYSDVNFVTTHKKVKITCKKHGTFEQTPKIHLNGHGCPNCSHSGFKPNLPAYLYVLEVVPTKGLEHLNNDFIGYGITNVLKNRLAKHKHNLKQVGFRIKRKHVFYFDSGYDASQIEKNIKRKRKAHVRIPVAGFKTEALSSNYKDQLIKYINKRVH